MRKYELISQLYNSISEKVVASPNEWRSFLKSACHNYRLRFDEQLLVYAQRPDATAVLEIERWNDGFGRWVNRGAKGIVVFEDGDRSKQRLNYYFDISDTHSGRFSRPVPIWEMKEEYTEEVISTLENTFGELGYKDTLEEAIVSASENAVEDNFQDYLYDLLNNLEGSTLNLENKTYVTDIFRQYVTNSVSFMLMTRLGLEPNDYFDYADFKEIKYFGTPLTLNALGFATSDIAEMGLSEIAKTILSLEREQEKEKKNCKIDGLEDLDYNQAKNKERGFKDERNNLLNEGGLSNSQYGNARANGDELRALRTNEENVSEREPQSPLLQPINQGGIESTFEPSGTGSIETRGKTNQGIDEKSRGNGGIESQRYDELGRENEQYQESSSRNSSEGNNLRLVFDRNNEYSSIPFLSNNNLIEKILLNAPCIKDKKDEIREFFHDYPDLKMETDYLKSIFNDEITEYYLTENKVVGYKTYENVLQIFEGEHNHKISQGFYDWEVITEYFEGYNLLGKLEDNIKPLPSLVDQITSIAVNAEKENSAFTFSQEIIDKVLTNGSGFSEGKYRIYEQFQKSLSKKENITFLKDEYGIGGTYPVILGTGISEDHNSNGIHLSKGIGTDSPKLDLSWSQIENRIGELIKLDRYLNLKEKENFPKWLENRELEQIELLEQQKNKEENPNYPYKNKLDDKDMVYKYKEGDKVYLGSSTYEILKIMNDAIFLYDFEYPLFNAEFSLKEFNEMLRENPLNDHLKVSKESLKVGQIDYLDNSGKVVETISYDNSNELVKEIEDDSFYGVPISVTLYKDNEGKSIPLDFLDNISSPLKELKVEENPYLKNKLEYAMDIIDEFCKKEFQTDEGANYSDLSQIDIGYTTTEDGKYEIQARLDLENFKINTFLDNVLIKTIDCKSLDNMIENHLKKLDFEELVYVSEEEIEKFEKENSKIIPNWEQEKNETSNEAILDIPMGEGNNFNLLDYPVEEVGKKERFRRNLSGINVLKNCLNENRFASLEEQIILSKYVGWGGIPEAFDEDNLSWQKEYKELKNALTEDEYSRARESTLTAFFTPPEVILGIYKAISQMGFRVGNILEPSCGVGNFMGLLPENMKESKFYGVELDPISAKICKLLYPKNNIAIGGFEEVDLPDSFFDCVVGNVPFGDFKVVDKNYQKRNFLIHDYFFAKSLDKLRPGGLMALITSKGTMDKENSEVRKYISERAQLLGAIRLPNNCFKGNGGTEVVSDILFLQKRDRLINLDEDWLYLGKTDEKYELNSYFVNHPEMILGELQMTSGRFGEELTVVPYENSNLSDLLNEAISNINGEFFDYEIEDVSNKDESIPADPNVRNFSYTIINDKVYFRENSRMNLIDVSSTAFNRIKGMIELRESVRKLIELETRDYSDVEIRKEQENLNRVYDNFTAKYGLINSRGNSQAFSSDSSYSLLSALEILDEEGNLERKADMFYKRTIKPHIPVTEVDTASEALAVSLSEKAIVDMDFMMKLSNKTEDEIYKELMGVIFLNPKYSEVSSEPKYLMSDEYLSGNVREKLREARKFAEFSPEDYQINVSALEKVQPKDLLASEISVRLGAIWIPKEIVESFIFEFLDTPRYAQWNIKVNFSKYNGEWNIEGKSYDRGNINAYSTYGTERINAYKIIEETLNLKDVRIFDYYEDDDGKKKAILNKKETALAQGKQELIKEGFKNWIWEEPKRREKLTKLYNEKFNSIRPREYDGSHINFVGMNPEIELREHQKNAVAHILYGGNTLLAHAVGAGKTYEMVASAMESKRLGLCSKSLFVVPNHLTEQWASEFLQLYPSANILVATKKDFETKNRKRFCGRIATGDYDAVIIGHSQFEKIPVSIERQRDILEKQIEEITEGIAEIKKNRGDKFSIKQMEKTKKTLGVKLQKLNDQSRKDDVVTFEELGVDRLFVDESHYYKNLFLYTKMRNVGGIAQTEAQKSSDLFMKCRYLDELTNGRGIVFATGTPISNSMVELYTIQRYLQYDTLLKNGLHTFDAWASTFGETITAVELTPEGTGYRAKTRFAKFYNLPELMAMFKEVADIKTKDMLNLPVPKGNFHNISVKPSEMQKELVKSLSERADRIREKMVDSSVDNMLLITNDGRKLALDQRLINDSLPDFQGSKVNACVDNIYNIWEETKDKKSTQLVFCDLSTPKNNNEFSVYTDIRNKLIRKGIPENEIKFIHEADTEIKKLELFKKMRKGDVRILMGSTQKLGAGTNVQNKLIALHDIDCPWRPSDLEQRCGRIIRQGNENEEVNIYRYVTEETFDAYLYQLVEGKQKFASQIMTSKSPVRSAEDIDETALSYAEIKMLATGNPYIKEKMDLDIQVQKLKILKSGFLTDKYALEDKIIKYYPEEITRKTNVILGLEKDIEKVGKHLKPSGDTFIGMEVKGVFIMDKNKAGASILQACKEMKSPNPVPLGEYRGFKMELSFDVVNREYRIKLKGELSYYVTLGSDIFGNITRLDNTLEGLANRLSKVKDELDNTKKQFDLAKENVRKPFPEEEKLNRLNERLNELNILLDMDKRENEIVSGEENDEANLKDKEVEIEGR